jgi:hypothetical protein
MNKILHKITWKLSADKLYEFTYDIHKHFGTKEAHTSKKFDSFRQKWYIEHWFGQFYMSKMPRTLWHIASTCLASRLTVNYTLTWIHQTIQLWPSTFHCFRIANTSFSDWHSPLQQHKHQPWTACCLDTYNEPHIPINQTYAIIILQLTMVPLFCYRACKYCFTCNSTIAIIYNYTIKWLAS